MGGQNGIDPLAQRVTGPPMEVVGCLEPREGAQPARQCGELVDVDKPAVAAVFAVVMNR